MDELDLHHVFQNEARVQILAELEKEKERLMQNQSVSTPGARVYPTSSPKVSWDGLQWKNAVTHFNIKALSCKTLFRSLRSVSISRHNMKDFRDSAEQQRIVAQQKAALQHAHAHSSGFFITQDSSFGNLILPVLPRLEPES
ncbi:SOSS complex subunit C-like isoform X2 [Vanacampus margaritifer]